MKKVSSVSKRLSEALEYFDISQAELVKRTGLNKGAISSYINARYEPKQNAIYAISKALNINESWLMGYDMPMMARKKEDSSEQVRNLSSVTIPLYEALCCGNGGFVDDNIIDYISLPSDILEPSKEYFAQYAHGDSMTGAGIHDGDLLVFEKTGHIDSGKIGCFCIDDNEAMCKRYRLTSDQEIYLMPANDKYDPIHIDIENQHFRCIGILATVISDRREK